MSKYDKLPKSEKQDIVRALGNAGTFPKDYKKVADSLTKDKKK